MSNHVQDDPKVFNARQGRVLAVIEAVTICNGLQFPSSFQFTEQVYAPRRRAEWLAKIKDAGVRRRAGLYYQQLDAML
jgi:hypothetical protein